MYPTAICMIRRLIALSLSLTLVYGTFHWTVCYYDLEQADYLSFSSEIYKLPYDSLWLGILYATNDMHFKMFKIIRVIMYPTDSGMGSRLRLCPHVSVRLYHSSGGRFASIDAFMWFISRYLRFHNKSQSKFPSQCKLFPP